jgi:DNA-binding response OmpR family regulator
MPSVLIVDDDTDLLEMMELVLLNANMKVDCLAEGSFLFESLSRFNPDILVMDIYLGDSDGRNLCHRLKTSERFKHIPVILYSAGIITHDSIQQALADAFIVKPFNVHELTSKITELVTRAN